MTVCVPAEQPRRQPVQGPQELAHLLSSLLRSAIL